MYMGNIVNRLAINQGLSVRTNENSSYETDHEYIHHILLRIPFYRLRQITHQ